MSKLKGQGTTAPLWRTVAPERQDSLFKQIEYMAEHGFHAWKIAEVCGCTMSQVYLACNKMRIRLRDYRDGKTAVAVQVIRLRPAMVKVIRKRG